MVCEKLPNPIEAQKIRFPIICKKILKKPEFKNYIENCDSSEEAPVVIFITKMISIHKSNISDVGLSNFINKTLYRI